MAPKMHYLLFVALVALGCGVAAGGSVPAIFVFGDSLVDVGNNNYLPGARLKANFPHNGVDFKGGVPTGRFSNGYNGIDYLARMLGFTQSPPAFLSRKNWTELVGVNFTGVNFASGGSGILDATGGTISLQAQRVNYEVIAWALIEHLGPEEASRFISESLFIFSTGNSDLFQYYASSVPKSITTNQQFIDSLITQLSNQLVILHLLETRKVVILGLGHLGCVPYLRNINPSGECIEELNQLARQFNIAIQERLKLISSALEGFKYSFVDVYYLTSLIKASPHQSGFKELKVACCGSGRYNGATDCNSNATYCPNRENHLFWDWYHPTQAMYKLSITKAYSGSGEFATPINIKELIDTPINIKEVIAKKGEAAYLSS